VFLSDATDITECHLPFVGQVELICAPIIQAVLPLHKPALLQLVDDRHQTARVHMEHLSQSLLAQPSGFAKDAENACVGRREAQWSKSLREFTSSVRPYLSEQECRRRRSLSSTMVCHDRLRLHITIVYRINDYYMKLVEVRQRIGEGRV